VLTIIVLYKDTPDIFKEYWLPLIYKHGGQGALHGACLEFIIVDNGSDNPLPDQGIKNLRIYTAAKTLPNDQAIGMAIRYAQNELILITDIHSLPTYQTMTLLQDLYNKNQTIWPVWFDAPDVKCENAFSILRSDFKKHNDIRKCAQLTQSSVDSTASMYRVPWSIIIDKNAARIKALYE